MVVIDIKYLTFRLDQLARIVCSNETQSVSVGFWKRGRKGKASDLTQQTAGERCVGRIAVQSMGKMPDDYGSCDRLRPECLVIESRTRNLPAPRYERCAEREAFDNLQS